MPAKQRHPAEREMRTDQDREFHFGKDEPRFMYDAGDHPQIAEAAAVSAKNNDGGNEATVLVNINDTVHMSTRVASLPKDLPAGRLLPAILTRLGMPQINAIGDPISYRLFVDGGEIGRDTTLNQAGVHSGSVLTVSAEATADELSVSTGVFNYTAPTQERAVLGQLPDTEEVRKLAIKVEVLKRVSSCASVDHLRYVSRLCEVLCIAGFLVTTCLLALAVAVNTHGYRTSDETGFADLILLAAAGLTAVAFRQMVRSKLAMLRANSVIHEGLELAYSIVDMLPNAIETSNQTAQEEIEYATSKGYSKRQAASPSGVEKQIRLA